MILVEAFGPLIRSMMFPFFLPLASNNVHLTCSEIFVDPYLTKICQHSFWVPAKNFYCEFPTHLMHLQKILLTRFQTAGPCLGKWNLPLPTEDLMPGTFYKMN